MNYWEIKRRDAERRRNQKLSEHRQECAEALLRTSDAVNENAGRRVDAALALQAKLSEQQAEQAGPRAACELPRAVFDNATHYLIPVVNSSATQNPDAPREIEGLPRRLDRASTAKRRTNNMAAFLEDADPETARKLFTCNTHRVFRHWLKTGDCRLIAARTCQLDRLCPVCANLRAGRNAARYHRRLQVVQHENDHKLTEWMWTFTVKDGPDLLERLNHLRKALKLLVDHRRKVRNGNRGSLWFPFAAVAGGVYSVEITIGKRSGLWHPHVHVYALHDGLIETQGTRCHAMESWWLARTGDSFVCDVRPIAESERGDAIVEVLKYSAKFSAMDLAENVHAWKVTSQNSMRLLGGFGLLRGVPDAKVLTDELSDDEGQFLDLAFKFNGYEFQPEATAERAG